MPRAAQAWPPGSGVAVAAAALLLGGALGKSAQLPLHTWLPDAMAGPTPVSALIHAATMVTAGVYLIARLHGLFTLAPQVLSAVAVIGAVTLLIAGYSALAQRDIKRVLAYSTMSQIGLMFLALGVGAWSAAIFHLMTHAFFKALLFLVAGVVILGLHHEHDIFRMGGLSAWVLERWGAHWARWAALVALGLDLILGLLLWVRYGGGIGLAEPGVWLTAVQWPWIPQFGIGVHLAMDGLSLLLFVLLGVFAWNELALQGVVLQMICHGLSTGGLFMLVGALQERLHTRDLRRLGGLWSTAPRLGGWAWSWPWPPSDCPGWATSWPNFWSWSALSGPTFGCLSSPPSGSCWRQPTPCAWCSRRSTALMPKAGAFPTSRPATWLSWRR
jgi:NADH:ubiquinone oxidoreductase subunit 5 (subunit L)/multisubunit Na+/H+ antiporter MnhA subunit